MRLNTLATRTTRLIVTCVLLWNCTNSLVAQQTKAQQILENITLTGDFRFRIEQDWNSRKADGTYRDDKSRLRYRLRFGASYNHKEWAEFGFRLRTGSLNDQQDPHITLGDKGGEFSTVQVGFEKLWFQAKHKWLTAWVGKNTYPFYKHDELFWNDNVFPEGVAVKTEFPFDEGLISSLSINAGHFIATHSKQSFSADNFFQGLQFIAGLADERIHIPVGIFRFNRVPNIPDGQGTFDISYTILHIAPWVIIAKQPRLSVGFDYFKNFTDLSSNGGIPDNFSNQTNGFSMNIKLGQLEQKGDWSIELFLAYLQKYSIVDYYAQNDWARWDYSEYGAAGSRLSNMKGVNLRFAYALGPNWNVRLQGYLTEQLLAEGEFTETGSRVRLDMNIGF